MRWNSGAALLALALLVASGLSPALEGAAPLPAPQWVGASHERGKIRLRWIQNPEFESVRVFRKRADGAEGFVAVGQTQENSFLDTAVQAGVAYTYRLTGIGVAGREGKPSTEMSLRPAAVEPRVLSPPDWEGHLILANGIGLKWSARDGEDAIAHNVYRKDPGEPQFELLASSRGTSYLDESVEPGRSYVYAITALDASFLETPLSQELRVTFAAAPAPAEKKPEVAWRVRRTRLVALVAGGGELAFERPADVAVGPASGNVYVADSGRNLVFVFSPQGVFQRTIGAGGGGSGAFRNLLGLAADRDENLYVVDAGAGAVQVVSPQGQYGRRLEVPSRAAGATGLIDAAVGAAGQVYVVDNFNNRVAILGRGGAQLFGKQGAQPGDFSAPTFCAVDAAGRLLVSDCLNARVQVFSADGEFVRAFGRFSRGPGGFGRPKGVAVSAAGEIYVADSWLNTVQVFDAEGRFVAILGDEHGRPLDLGAPNGVALGADNRVYVAERLAARLQVRELVDAR
ncbi:MAG: hypothetical protein HY825_00445 [Acidobacteria bacterium]|nr:hypothetical protein [Acidobacteriota bacterium]